MQTSRIFVGLLLIAVLFIAGCTSKSKPKDLNETSNVTCRLNNCHGLSVKCEEGEPLICTQEYRIGDFCRAYIECYEYKGHCKTNYTKTFRECKSCVNECLKNSMPFECEKQCIEEIENLTK